MASVDSGNLQPFCLEPRGSADDPVMHNSEWLLLQLLTFSHVFMSTLATQMRIAVALDSQAQYYEVSWLENNHSSCPHVALCPQSINSDKFNFVLKSMDKMHTPDACKQQCCSDKGQE